MPEDIEDVTPEPSTGEESETEETELDDDGETTAEDETETEDAGEGDEEEDGEEPDDLDAPRIPRRRFNEAVQKERDKRDAALAAAGMRWDEETQTVVPAEPEKPALEPQSTEPTAEEAAWFAMPVDEMADDPQWRAVAQWYRDRGIEYDLDTMDTNAAATFKHGYRVAVDAAKQEAKAADEAAEQSITGFYESLDARPELAGLDPEVSKAVKDQFTVIFRKEAAKRGGRPSALTDYTEPALGLAVLKNLDAIVAARGGQAVKAEKTRIRAVGAGQAGAPTPASKQAATSLTPEQRAVAQQFGMTPEQYAANMGD